MLTCLARPEGFEPPTPRSVVFPAIFFDLYSFETIPNLLIFRFIIVPPTWGKFSRPTAIGGLLADFRHTWSGRFFASHFRSKTRG